jgi:hypothetical protein
MFLFCLLLSAGSNKRHRPQAHPAFTARNPPKNREKEHKNHLARELLLSFQLVELGLPASLASSFILPIPAGVPLQAGIVFLRAFAVAGVLSIDG